MKRATRKTLVVCAAVFLAAALGFGGFYWHSIRRISAAVDRIGPALPGVAAVEVGRIRTDPFGTRIELKTVSIRLDSSQTPIRIDSVTIEDADYSHPVPLRMQLAVKGARILPADHWPSLAGAFPAGVVPDALAVDLQAAYRYRPERRALDLQRFELAEASLGELSVSGRFDNLDIGRIVEPPIQPEVVFGVVSAARILEAESTYRDRSLVRETIRRRAERRGQTPAQHARILVEILRLRGEGEPGGLLARTLRPLERFLADPDRLRISVRPRRPVTFGWLLWVRNPDRLIDLLGLRMDA